MRVLRIILTSLLAAAAVVAGLFVTAVVALTALVAFLARGFFRPRRDRAVPPPHVRRPVAGADVIDVTATEVPAKRIDR